MLCGGLGAKPPLFCVRVWEPSHNYLCCGLGAKPELFVWWFGSHTTTICVVAWEPHHNYFCRGFGAKATTKFVVVWEHENSGGVANCGGFEKMVVPQQPQNMCWHRKKCEY
jgi:hypothetical protein